MLHDRLTNPSTFALGVMIFLSATFLLLFVLEIHVVRVPGESLWRRLVAIKSGRRDWSLCGPSYWLLAVMFICELAGTMWCALLAVPAYMFLGYRLFRTVRPRPRMPLPALQHVAPEQTDTGTVRVIR